MGKALHFQPLPPLRLPTLTAVKLLKSAHQQPWRQPVCQLTVLPGLAAALLGLHASLAPAQEAAGTLEAAQLAPAQALVQQGANTALATFAGLPARVVVTVGAPDPRLRLAPCRRTEAHWPPGQRALGRTRVGLRCVDGPQAWNISLPAQVSVLAPGVVAAVALPAGTRLAPEHLSIAEVDWALQPEGTHAEPSALLGRELLRPLTAGTALRSNDLRQRQWFAAGEMVQITARGAGFAVSAEGEALTPGVEGQPVRVKTSSGRVLSGRASGQRRVDVLL
jgi:flagellar basal body P-ring formation protein FlgA